MGVSDLLILGVPHIAGHPSQVLDPTLSLVLGNQALLLLWVTGIVGLPRDWKNIYVRYILLYRR